MLRVRVPLATPLLKVAVERKFEGKTLARRFEWTPPADLESPIPWDNRMRGNKAREVTARARGLRRNAASVPLRAYAPAWSRHCTSARTELFAPPSHGTSLVADARPSRGIRSPAALRLPGPSRHLRNGFRSGRTHPIPSSAATHPSGPRNVWRSVPGGGNSHSWKSPSDFESSN